MRIDSEAPVESRSDGCSPMLLKRVASHAYLTYHQQVLRVAETAPRSRGGDAMTIDVLDLVDYLGLRGTFDQFNLLFKISLQGETDAARRKWGVS